VLVVNQFHVALYTAALLVCVTSLIYTMIQSRAARLQNKVYIVMLLIVIVNAITSVVCELLEPYMSVSPTCNIAFKTTQFCYFLVHTALGAAFCFYVMCVTGEFSKLNKAKNMLYSSVFCLTEFFVLLNPFMHWVYYIDENYQFRRNWAENLIYLAGVFYLVLAMFRLLHSWNALNKRRRRALLYFYCLVVAGVIIQLINIDIKSELFAEALALMGVMLAVESEDDRLDADTGLYNRRALQMDLDKFISAGRSFHVICLKVTNADLIQRVTGSANADILTEIVADFLKSVLPWYCIYHTNPETFVFRCMEMEADDVEALTARIRERFKKSWICQGKEIILNSIVVCAEIPAKLHSTGDVFYLADSPVPANIGTEALAHNTIDFLMRRAEVERAIHRGFAENHFEVFYQPTYHLKGPKIHGAEALIRLNDNVLGFIPPDEFIPVAEQIGMIGQIGDFVLRDVCDFLKSGIPEKNGLECINVNLSVVQFLQPDFVGHVLEIIDSYGVDKKRINFEITETIAANDYQILNSVVKQLKENGILFSMDDYGTGYSNIQSVFALDFDVVKIDKSILWGAEKSDMGRIILESSTHMIHEMKRKILVEGVETQEQINLLADLSVDYLQGYFFSKPVPKKALIEMISR